LLQHPIIIAGGLGERCRPITDFRPKCLIPINGVPILQLQLNQLISIGYKKVTVLLGYMAEEVTEFLRYIDLNIEIELITTPEKYSSLERIIHALPSIESDRLLVIYCDNYIETNVLFTISQHTQNSFVIQKRDKGNISVNTNGARYVSSTRSSDNNFVELGYFIISRHDIEKYQQDSVSLEDLLIHVSNLTPFLWIEISKYFSLSNFQQVLLSNSNSKIVFLDRDGVICAKPPHRTYTLDLSSIEFVDKNILGLIELANRNYLFVVCTNQPAVGLGLITSGQLKNIHRFICLELIKKGIHVLDFVSCEHSWELECSCRKPKPGLLIQSRNDFESLMGQSPPIYIGDQPSDKAAAVSAGFRPFLVNNSEIIGTAESIVDLIDQITAHSNLGE
jgi:D-glycero-D-manno-heptose 1,7-bisphosphate phosphatase